MASKDCSRHWQDKNPAHFSHSNPFSKPGMTDKWDTNKIGMPFAYFQGLLNISRNDSWVVE
jgi:hypothetical protein